MPRLGYSDAKLKGGLAGRKARLNRILNCVASEKGALRFGVRIHDIGVSDNARKITTHRHRIGNATRRVFSSCLGLISVCIGDSGAKFSTGSFRWLPRGRTTVLVMVPPSTLRESTAHSAVVVDRSAWTARPPHLPAPSI